MFHNYYVTKYKQRYKQDFAHNFNNKPHSVSGFFPMLHNVCLSSAIKYISTILSTITVVWSILGVGVGEGFIQSEHRDCL